MNTTYRGAVRRMAAVLLVLGLAAAGCGGGGSADAPDDDDDRELSLGDRTTTTVAAGTEDREVVCEQLGIVDRLDREAARASDSALAQMRAGADPSVAIAGLHETAAMLSTGMPQIAAAYAAAAAAAEPDVAADIAALASASAVLLPLMIDAFNAVASVDDLATLEQAFASPELLAAAQAGASATLSLTRFTEVVCGFSISD